MKQLLQDLKAGKTLLVEVPCPAPSSGQVLIHTRASLISLGTEKMLVEFSQANLLQKARQQPDKVKQVLDKIKNGRAVAPRSKRFSTGSMSHYHSGAAMPELLSGPTSDLGPLISEFTNYSADSAASCKKEVQPPLKLKIRFTDIRFARSRFKFKVQR